MKKIIISLICILLSLIMAVGCTSENSVVKTTDEPASTPESTSTPEPTTAPEEETYTFTLADLGDNVILHTEKQLGYLNDSLDSIAKYATGEDGLDKPEPVHFTWDFEPPDGKNVSSYELVVGEDLNSDEVWSVKTSKKFYDLYNLKVGTKYCWYVIAYASGKTYKSQTAYFTTEDTNPRMLYIDGIVNVRDLGGWKTEDGGRIKQGLVFRCSKLNENGGSRALITQKGINAFKGQLNVKTEIDLRPADRAYVTKSVLGDDINHIVVGMTNKGNIFLDQSEQIKEVLSVFADESNYPIAFHCSGGSERAGVIAFVIEGLCGMSAEDICRDYMMSNFVMTADSYFSYTLIESYIEDVKKAGGNTLAEQFRNYLLGIGLTEAQLDEIVRIMKE